MQRLLSNFVTSQPANDNNNDMPWLFVTGARGFATFAGLISILLGAINLILSPVQIVSLNFYFMIASIILMGEGLVMTMIEAPFLCMFLDFAFLPNKFMEGKSLWVKATLYLSFAIIPISFYSTVSPTACVFIFISSALYLVLALGRKASAEEMRAKIVNENPSSVLVNNEVLPATSGSNSVPFYKQTQINSPAQTGINNSMVY